MKHAYINIILCYNDQDSILIRVFLNYILNCYIIVFTFFLLVYESHVETCHIAFITYSIFYDLLKIKVSFPVIVNKLKMSNYTNQI